MFKTLTTLAVLIISTATFAQKTNEFLQFEKELVSFIDTFKVSPPDFEYTFTSLPSSFQKVRDDDENSLLLFFSSDDMLVMYMITFSPSTDLISISSDFIPGGAFVTSQKLPNTQHDLFKQKLTNCLNKHS